MVDRDEHAFSKSRLDDRGFSSVQTKIWNMRIYFSIYSILIQLNIISYEN